MFFSAISEHGSNPRDEAEDDDDHEKEVDGDDECVDVHVYIISHHVGLVHPSLSSNVRTRRN